MVIVPIHYRFDGQLSLNSSIIIAALGRCSISCLLIAAVGAVSTTGNFAFGSEKKKHVNGRTKRAAPDSTRLYCQSAATSELYDPPLPELPICQGASSGTIGPTWLHTALANSYGSSGVRSASYSFGQASPIVALYKNRLGILYLKFGKRTEASQEFKEAIDIEKNSKATGSQVQQALKEYGSFVAVTPIFVSKDTLEVATKSKVHSAPPSSEFEKSVRLAGYKRNYELAQIPIRRYERLGRAQGRQ